MKKKPNKTKIIKLENCNGFCDLRFRCINAGKKKCHPTPSEENKGMCEFFIEK